MGKKNKLIFVAATLVAAGMLSGCGQALPEMTEQQEEAIVDYAAELIMVNLRDYNSRLVDLSLYPSVNQTQETEPEVEVQTGMDEVDDTPVVDVGEEPLVSVSLEEALMLDGVTIQASGYLVADSYPDDASNHSFSLDTSAGNKLLVMAFTLSNDTGEQKDVDIFSVSPNCTVSVNGRSQNILSTLMLDDLSTYLDTLRSGESVDLVLLAEVREELITDIETLELTISTQAGVAQVTLQ